MNKLLTIIFTSLVVGTGCSYLPEPGEFETDIVFIETADYIEIIPDNFAGSNTGFIFYPGGLVDPNAYQELGSMFANSGIGHHVIIAKMPANLAVLGSKAALKITKDFPDENWVIGGHSLGGSMACSMVKKESSLFKGLILMASYPSQSTDLSKWEGAVLSLSASKDKVVNQENFEDAKSNLPGLAVYYEIDGGNHSGFGFYGDQKGDGVAEISRMAQHQQIVEQIQNFYLENGFE